MSNPPKQECLGPFCPVFDNLSVNDPSVVGKTRSIRSVGFPANMFEQIDRTGEVAGTSGVKIKKTFKK